MTIKMVTKTAFLLPLAILAFTVTALAGPPGKPIGFAAVYMPNSAGDVVLKWQMYPHDDKPEYYTVYMADGEKKTYDGFKDLGNVLASKDSGITYETDFAFTVNVNTVNGPGAYSFYVTATNADGVSPNTEIAIVYIRNTPHGVWFISQPMTAAFSTKEYYYDANAQSLTGAEIRYKIDGAPTGATMDDVTGELRFTPTGVSEELFSVIAYEKDNPSTSATQQWHVKFLPDSLIHPPKQCAEIHGFLYDENGQLFITKGRVSAMLLGSANTPLETITVELARGEYWIPVKTPGSYVLYIEGQGFQPEYFEDAATAADAKRLDIQCNTKTEADFHLQTANAHAVRFTTAPKDHVDVGEEYKYDADAVSSDGRPVEFKAIAMPPDATLDPQTGLLQFKSDVPDFYKFVIRAFVTDDPSLYAEQSWALRVSNDSNVIHPPKYCATVRGTIVDENGQKIDFGMVHGVLLGKDSLNNAGAVTTGRVYQGEFWLTIPTPGEYSFYFFGEHYEAEWYEDAADLANARRVAIACGDTAIVNFNVASITMHTVQGTVTSKEDGSPLQAHVIFESPQGKLHFETKTDAHGNYTATVAGNRDYIVSAYPATKEYFQQYYNLASDMVDADPLFVNTDMTGIDFQLEKRPVYPNGISGWVRNEAGNGIISLVSVWKESNANNTAPFTHAVLTDTIGNGSFLVESLEPGTYIVSALPLMKDYVHGYYKESSLAVKDWNDATRITVTDNGIVDGIVIVLAKRGGVKGVASIHGVIKAKRNGFAGGEIEPLANANVYLVDANNEVSDFTTTYVDGFYQMNEVGSGLYTLVVDKPGYKRYEETITVDYIKNPGNERNFDLAPAGTVSVDNVVARVFTVSVYPNPAVSSFSVTVNGLQENTVLNLYNSLGAQVYSTVVRASGGSAQVQIPASALPTGLYFVRLGAANGASLTPVTIMR